MTWVWNCSRSRHGARLVLLAIADCASADGGNAWPSNAELRRKSGLGERAVQSAVAELVSLGELEVAWNKGPKGCNSYRVIMDDPRNICTPAESAPPQKMRGSGKRGKSSSQVSAEDPAESAPPQILRPPPQILRGPPAESAPVTVLEPKANRQQKKTSSSSAARATRIPDDFAVTADMVAWARENVPSLVAAGLGTRETEKFRNYWRAKAGRDATKHDWVATWRNWLLKAEDDLARNGTRTPAPAAARASTTDQRVAQAQALKAELRAAQNGQLA